MRLLIIWILSALPALAQTHKAGDFDYYVMALSWSPSWCAIKGDARNSDQCDARHDHGWILHGLWPQYKRGYPEFCQTAKRPPSRSMTSDMADIMGTPGLAWHQWKKHGTCTGLASADYYDLSRKAYGTVARPEVFRRLEQTINVAPKVVEQAFLQANPNMEPDQITITCKQGHIQEARICLTKI